MTQQQKLQKIIEKAIENGWEKKIFHAQGTFNTLFDHSFAKAIWGEEKKVDVVNPVTGSTYTCMATAKNVWKVHLQKAVISEDPIDYYYNNLPVEN